MPVPTVDPLRRTRRQQQRRLDSLLAVLDEMRGGQALHLYYDGGRGGWVLTDGREVQPEIARLVITQPSVAGVGDGLFGDCHGQTWRYIESNT
jgi:hypothetical protein